MTAILDDELADLRRANAELQQRLDEALARESATAEVLQVINSSPGDLAPVFDAMLEKATVLSEASFGILMTYDGEIFQTVALRGTRRLRGTFAEPVSPSTTKRSWPSARGERLIHIEDIRADKAYRTGDPLRVATADGANVRLPAAKGPD